MRTHALAAAALLAAVALPARAQLSPHAIAVESGLSASLGGGAAGLVPVAVSTAVWLDGELDLVLRAAFASAPRTTDRPADGWFTGTAGLRWSLAPGSLRPQLLAEAGWARGTGDRARDGLALGAGVALEWFFARDVSIAAALAARWAPPAVTRGRLDATLAVAAYF